MKMTSRQRRSVLAGLGAVAGWLLVILMFIHGPAWAQRPVQPLVDLIIPSPQPTQAIESPSPLDNSPPPELSPDGTLVPSPAPIQLPEDAGTDVVVGGIPVLKLQTAQYSSEVRAQAVESEIERFLEFDRTGSLPVPEVRAIQTDELQYTLWLGDADSFVSTQRYLFTVTLADAAAALDAPSPTLRDVSALASTWANELERAIAEYREVELALVRGQDPRVLAISLLQAGAILLLGFFLWSWCRFGINRFEQVLENRMGEGRVIWVDVSLTLSRLLLRLGIALGSIDLALRVVPMLRPFQRVLYYEIGRMRRFLFNILNQELPNSSLSVSSLIIFAVLTLLVFTISHYISLALKHRFLTRLGLDLGTQEASATIFKYTVTVLGMLIVLPFSGLSLSSLAVVAGSLVLGVGLGLQNIFNDYVSYVAILIERPIQVGDLVEVDSLLGTVERIHPWATVVRTLDRVFVVVPNSRLTNQKVVNWSYRDPRCRIHIPVGVAYGSDPQQVKEAMLSAARCHPLVLSTPEPQVWLIAFGHSSMDFELLVWINRPQDQFILKSDLNYAIVAEFRRRHIVIPFNQQDLHIRSAEGLRGVLHHLNGSGHNNAKAGTATPASLKAAGEEVLPSASDSDPESAVEPPSQIGYRDDQDDQDIPQA
jgi:small-conductance mechanosensitive channel